MVSASLFFGVVGGLTTTVLAHGNVFNFTTNGVYNQGFLRRSTVAYMPTRS